MKYEEQHTNRKLDPNEDPLKEKLDKAKILDERNDPTKAFKQNWEQQKIRDQVVMPVDDLPLKDIELEKEEERNKEKTKSRSSSEKI
jgi:hypothetical protein